LRRLLEGAATVIDTATEFLLSLAQAAPLFPPGRNGARPTIGCFTRWILKGVKGPTGELVRLEAVRLGGKWVTSREAIQRFAERLTPRLDDEPPAAPRTPNQRRRASEAAARELEQMGI
jgi:hypothetical protein